MTMQHWTQILANVSLWEFVILAALTLGQWLRHRIKGAGWAALAFGIIGGISVVAKVDPTIVTNETTVKVLIALLMLVPYCLFQFAGSFRRPPAVVQYAAVALTIAVIVFTFTLQYVPEPGAPPPADFFAYRLTFCVQWAFLFSYVVIRLFLSGRDQPRIAKYRMRLLAIATAGLELQVVVAALGISGITVQFVDQLVTVVMGVLFLGALVLPGFVRSFLGRREDQAFRRGMTELVTAGGPKQVAEGLLPHVCALVGASRAALLEPDGTPLAAYPPPEDGDGQDGAAAEPWWDAVGPNDAAAPYRIRLQHQYGETHVLVVAISPFMPYFGGDELAKLHQLADMVGLALERSEMAEQMAYQASHDALTGLVNRAAFVEQLDLALSHVGRRFNALAVMFIDLDRFKSVNDKADHTAGDAVLQEMSRRLAAATRRVDVVARFGGDEFVAFAEVDNEAEAMDMAERFRSVLSAPFEVAGSHIILTASVGVVVTTDEMESSTLLLHEADLAMYEAKHAGRDRVVLSRSRARAIAKEKWGLARGQDPGHPGAGESGAGA
ncbi:MAG TPA: GGDEF domain-containing protein [Acidimicrobiales bacterium]|nr:GGDEF domain-containing protein [Acidimicrobiales bacterium]